MIDYINATRTEHIMTIEDPIEFLHRDKKSARQPARDRRRHPRFAPAPALGPAPDPDVILGVGEMRDYETIETALLAAETGHWSSRPSTPGRHGDHQNRIISVSRRTTRSRFRIQLGQVVKSVISLRLLPRADGIGRVPAVEVLITTPYIRGLHREQEKTKYIPKADRLGTSQYRDADLRPVALPT